MCGSQEFATGAKTAKEIAWEISSARENEIRPRDPRAFGYVQSGNGTRILNSFANGDMPFRILFCQLRIRGW